MSPYDEIYGFSGNYYTNPGASTGAGAGAAKAATGAAKNAKTGYGQKLGGWFKNNFSGLGTYIDPTNYSWHLKKGTTPTGKKFNAGLTFTNPKTGKPTSLAKWGNIASLAMNGINVAQGIGDYMGAVNANEDLMSKIQTSAMGNPLLSSYLTQDQLDLLGDIQLGNYDADENVGADDFLKGALGGIGDAAMGVLMGIPGGLPGMIIGGGGALLNSGINAVSGAAGQNTAELQALYQALQDADMQYKSMKRPNFTGLGIQQRYQDMYA